MNRATILASYTAGAAAQIAVACRISTQYAVVLSCWLAVWLLVLLAALRGKC